MWRSSKSRPNVVFRALPTSGRRDSLSLARFALACLLFLCLGAPAMAQLCQANFSNINFGTIDPTNGFAADAAGTMTVQCQGLPNRTARLCPNLGSGTGGDGGNGLVRKLTSGVNALNYTLYQDAARTVVWGSYVWPWTAQASAPQIDIPLGTTGQATRSYPVYGRVFAGQATAPTGTYQSSFSGGHILISSGYSTVGGCSIISGAGGLHPNFTVTANITRTCSLTTTPLNFGSWGNLATAIDGSAQLRVTCTSGTPYTIGLNGGLANATNPTQRKMVKGASSITYGLYGNAARTQGWFNTNAFYQGGGAGTGVAQTLTVYGRIPVQTTPPAGVYTDTVVVVVTY